MRRRAGGMWRGGLEWAWGGLGWTWEWSIANDARGVEKRGLKGDNHDTSVLETFKER